MTRRAISFFSLAAHIKYRKHQNMLLRVRLNMARHRACGMAASTLNWRCSNGNMVLQGREAKSMVRRHLRKLAAPALAMLAQLWSIS